MKRNYVYLLILILVTVVITLFLSNIYKKEVIITSHSYEKLNKITALEFEEYIIENPDTIIYLGDKTNLDNNKFEKKFISKLENLNLIKNTIYIDKTEITSSLKKVLEKEYSYNYDENKLPVVIVINDGKTIQKSNVYQNSKADTIINYEVFEW